MQQEAHQVSADGFACHPLQDIQPEKGTSKDHMPAMRISHEYYSDLYSQTAGQAGDRLHMIGKGDIIM